MKETPASHWPLSLHRCWSQQEIKRNISFTIWRRRKLAFVSIETSLTMKRRLHSWSLMVVRSNSVDSTDRCLDVVAVPVTRFFDATQPDTSVLYEFFSISITWTPPTRSWAPPPTGTTALVAGAAEWLPASVSGLSPSTVLRRAPRLDWPCLSQTNSSYHTMMWRISKQQYEPVMHTPINSTRVPTDSHSK